MSLPGHQVRIQPRHIASPVAHCAAAAAGCSGPAATIWRPRVQLQRPDHLQAFEHVQVVTVSVCIVLQH
jgi:hypothetical protein